MGLDALDRRRFIQGATAAGGGLAMTGPLSALSAATAEARKPQRATGYGQLYPTPDEDTGRRYLALPRGFRYRVINRSYDPSIAYPVDGGGPVELPTPTTFDGMGAFAGPNGTTILVRNHENRGDEGEQPVVVPESKRYDKAPTANAGLTKLVVGANRKLVEPPLHLLGGTSTNCAGGVMPWGSWVTCEETLDSTGDGFQQQHGYAFEASAVADRPVEAVPIRAAGRFKKEAVTWYANVLYQTEDEREKSGFYRYRPTQQISAAGQLAASSGPLEALVIRGMPQADADTLEVGRAYPVAWVKIDNPDPNDSEPLVHDQARAKGAAWFDRLEGCWEAGGRIYFDATEGGRPDRQDASGTDTEELGQLFEYDPGRGTLTLLFASPSPDVLQNPDNLVVVPATGDIFLQEDSPGLQYVRGVTLQGAIYDFAQTIVNTSEFCGGCFSPDGGTFFLNQQGSEDGSDDSERGLTYAIWGPFARKANGNGNGNGNGKAKGHSNGNGKGKGRRR